MSGARVVLAEDDVLLRAGLASLLQRSGFEIVGEAGDGPRLLSVAARFPLAATAAAHEAVERGGKVGTVVVEPQR